jgi:hypothetical protein
VVSFTPLPLYPRGKSPRYPLDRRLGGPQNVNLYIHSPIRLHGVVLNQLYTGQLYFTLLYFTLLCLALLTLSYIHINFPNEAGSRLGQRLLHYQDYKIVDGVSSSCLPAVTVMIGFRMSPARQ